MKLMSFREGTGVFAEPEELNIRYFFSLIKENFFALIYLNLIFVLSCLPIITIGPAVKSLSTLTMNLVRGKPVTVFHDYVDHFKAGLSKSILHGLSVIISVLILLFSLYFYISVGGENLVVRMIAVTTFVFLLIFLMINLYYVKSKFYIELDAKSQLKNAILLAISEPKALMICTITVFLPTYFLFTRMIVGFTALVLWQFSLNSLITSLVGYKVLKDSVLP